MEQGQVDVVRFGPLGDALLRGVQGKGGGGRAGVLRGIGVAEHDFHLAAGGLQTSLDLRDLDHFLEHVHRVLQILKLLEQRDDVDDRHIGFVCGAGQNICGIIRLLNIVDQHIHLMPLQNLLEVLEFLGRGLRAFRDGLRVAFGSLIG